MEDKSLYETILGLRRPWYVDQVDVQSEREAVLVYLEIPEEAPLTCPECDRTCPRYDRSGERRWRHLDTCQYQTFLVARLPRVACPDHGVRQIKVPWAEGKSRFTALFEAFGIRMLRETTTMGMARIMGITWDEAAGLQKRAVARGLQRRKAETIRFVGIDEKSFQKRHEYVTVAADLEKPRVLWVGDDRTRETLEAFYTVEMGQRRDEIQAVVMDMWQPYIGATEAQVPAAAEKIVFDKFHIVQHLVDAVDQVRRQEHARLRREGESGLKGTKYLWLKGSGKRTRADALAIRALRRAGFQVGRAWAIKEAGLRLWEYTSPTWARKYFKRWYFWATHSRLAPIIRVAKMMKAHLVGILAALRHGLTNAITEGLNTKIQEIKYRARGYRNRENFRMAILFHCGGLDMDPR